VWLPGSLGLFFVAGWIAFRPATHETALAVLPWVLGSVLICRLLAAAWALRLVLQRGLLAPRTATVWVASWLVLAMALFALLAWGASPERAPVIYLAFVVLFAFPMVRLAAAPLALAWNRHR
jgi:hypothetical protein